MRSSCKLFVCVATTVKLSCDESQDVHAIRLWYYCVSSWCRSKPTVLGSSNLNTSCRWMTTTPSCSHSRAWAMEHLAPQHSQCVGRLGAVRQYRRCNASLDSIFQRGKFHRRILVGFAVTCLFLGFWEWYVYCAAGIGSVMRWSSCSWSMKAIFGCSDCCFCCCHGLGMLSYLKGRLIFQCSNEMSANILTSLLIRRCAIGCVC